MTNEMGSMRLPVAPAFSRSRTARVVQRTCSSVLSLRRVLENVQRPPLALFGTTADIEKLRRHVSVEIHPHDVVGQSEVIIANLGRKPDVANQQGEIGREID